MLFYLTRVFSSYFWLFLFLAFVSSDPGCSPSTAVGVWHVFGNYTYLWELAGPSWCSLLEMLHSDSLWVPIVFVFLLQYHKWWLRLDHNVKMQFYITTWRLFYWAQLCIMVPEIVVVRISCRMCPTQDDPERPRAFLWAKTESCDICIIPFMLGCPSLNARCCSPALGEICESFDYALFF